MPASSHAKVVKLSSCLANHARVAGDECKFAYVLHQCTEILKNNGVVAVPTDTIYGVCCLADSTSGVDRIYQLKNRDYTKPLSVCVASLGEVYTYSKVTISRELLSELLPGPNTLIFERTHNVLAGLNPNTSRVGIRLLEEGSVAGQLIRKAGTIALTSANRSSEPSPLSVHDFESIWGHLDMVLDAGVLSTQETSREGSTIIDLSDQGRYKIIRKGSNYARATFILDKYGLEA